MAKHTPTPDKIFLASLEFVGYTLQAVAPTEDAAKRALLKAVRSSGYCENGKVPCRHRAPMSATKYWDYAGGHVREMKPGDVEWG